ncbi:MAG TPA: acetyl-CoA carboxylase carboxyl transferase subunit alpha, partial [Chthonomonadales bacterium]|nr:acetyl-CoA carboxylase carboxyl transferase subunit alpha [Chthonomonadales bacterium]
MPGNQLDIEKPIAELDELIAELKRVGRDPEARRDAEARGIDIESEIAKVEKLRGATIRQVFS